ncbi:MAG: transglutaminase domain-containing protein [Deltaproteobacteria bacterium]|nr:MAG: transglutaminase domain-containing protein [Deltaproteobacteria bacterium]
MKLRLVIILVWIVLISLLVSRNLFIPDVNTDISATLAQARETSFYGIWFKNRRIGYVENNVHPKASGGFYLDQRAFLRLNVLDRVEQVDMHLAANLDSRQRLEDFDFSFRAPFYVLKARGKVDGHTMSFVTDTGGETRKEMAVLKDLPLIDTHHRSFLLNPVPAPGHKVKIPFFDPLSLSSRETIVEYVGQEKILIKARIYRLHHFRSSFSGVRINSWLDKNGKVIKEESPAGFIFLSEPAFKAHNIQDSGEELLSAVAVPYSGILPEKTQTTIDYRLEMPSDEAFDLDGGRQQYKDRRLRIKLEDIAAGADSRTGGPGCGDPAAMLPSRYVQSDHPEIIAQAEALMTGGGDTLKKVRFLAAWIYEHIDKRPVIGLPDALATLHGRKGDCNEHAALFAALARAAGIPARIASGVMRHQDRFYYHAWNEVCLDGQWVSLDTTRNQLPADLTHIRLVIGDLEEQVRISTLLGKLKIKIMPWEDDEYTGNN